MTNPTPRKAARPMPLGRPGTCPVCGGNGRLGSQCRGKACSGARFLPQRRKRPTPRKAPRSTPIASADATVLVPIIEVPRRTSRAEAPRPKRRAVASPAGGKTVMMQVPPKGGPHPRRARQANPPRREPTKVSPAFTLTPEVMARAMSQQVIAGTETQVGAEVAPAAAGGSSGGAAAGPTQTSEMQVVSALAEDWSGVAETTSPHPQSHPERRSRRSWLVPFLASAAAAVTLIGIVTIASSDDDEPDVVQVATPIPAVPAVVVVTQEPAAESAVAKVEVDHEPDHEPEPDVAAKEPLAPAWVRDNAEVNPWVAVAGASGEVVLGLSEERASRAEARGLTGFDPAMQITAPIYAYELQTHEVTWGELDLFIAAERVTGLTTPEWMPTDAGVRSRMPATSVPWNVAQAYCTAIGGILPSEAEWAWAARGQALRDYPWGSGLPYANLVRIRADGDVPLSEVATMTQDVTPGDEPLHDLLGNAAEWTRDRWVPSRGDVAPTPDDARRAVRGWPLGEAGAPLPTEGLTYRRAECSKGDCMQDADLDLIGFRCMRSVR